MVRSPASSSRESHWNRETPGPRQSATDTAATEGGTAAGTIPAIRAARAAPPQQSAVSHALLATDERQPRVVGAGTVPANLPQELVRKGAGRFTIEPRDLNRQRQNAMR